MAASELVSVFVLRHYLEYSIASYLLSVHGRCMLVAAVSLVIPYLVYDKFMEPCFLRLVMTCVTTSVSVILTSLYIGMDKSMRAKLYGIVRSRIKRLR